jgi:ATP-dependent RNA helicase RhlE
MKFSELDVRPEILKAVTEMGYQDLTPIQEKTISHVLNGRDLFPGQRPARAKQRPVVFRWSR